jgi:hypothetical protein
MFLLLYVLIGILNACIGSYHYHALQTTHVVYWFILWPYYLYHLYTNNQKHIYSYKISIQLTCMFVALGYLLIGILFVSVHILLYFVFHVQVHIHRLIYVMCAWPLYLPRLFICVVLIIVIKAGLPHIYIQVKHIMYKICKIDT